MKLKKKCDKISTDDFYYDLFDGGYIKPEEFLENREDIEKLTEAINLIVDFKEKLENKNIIIYH